MKILFITRKYPPSKGGMETLSYNLTTKYPGEKKIIPMKEKNQMHLVWFLPYCFFYLLFNSKKIEILHLSDMVLVILGGWIKKLNNRTKVAINIHGLDVNFSERKGLLAKIYKSYLKLFAKEKNYDLLICNSHNTEKIAKENGFSKTTIIPIGVNLKNKMNSCGKEELYKIIGDQYKDKKCLLTVGRLVKRKGVNWFIDQVMPLIREDAIYLVVGEPDWLKNVASELDLIRETIRQNKLEKRVILLGKVSDEKLEILYQTADLCIMPSIPVIGDSEGFGIVAIEAAARGLPVVASKLEGITEAVQDGKNGFLLPPGDAVAFKEKIELLLKENRELIRKQAKEFTLENFSWDNLIPKYQIAFKNLCRE